MMVLCVIELGEMPSFTLPRDQDSAITARQEPERLLSICTPLHHNTTAIEFEIWSTRKFRLIPGQDMFNLNCRVSGQNSACNYNSSNCIPVGRQVVQPLLSVDTEITGGLIILVQITRTPSWDMLKQKSKTETCWQCVVFTGKRNQGLINDSSGICRLC